MTRFHFRRIAAAICGMCFLQAAHAYDAATVNVLHTEPSKFSPVVVYEAFGERCMTFGSVDALGRQSCYGLQQPQRMVFNYTRMMMASLFVAESPRRILIVGLGGGTLPAALAELLPESHIDTVEIDPAVQRMAQQYFGFRTSARQQVHEMDGRAFVEHAVAQSVSYDLILLDAFDFNYIPRHLMTKEFLTQVRALLAPGGWLAANTFTSSNMYEDESATYRAVFGDYYNLRANNRVILATNGPLPEQAVIRQGANRWKDRLAPYGVETEKLLALVAKAPKDSGRVITD